MSANKMETPQDWDNPDLTQEEYAAMAEWYANVHGEGNLDLNKFLPYYMTLRPDALKKYRRWVEYVPAGRDFPDGIHDPAPLVWLHNYTTDAYSEGHLYEIIMAKEFGASRAEVAQTIILGMLHGGPRGLNGGADLSLEYMERWHKEAGEETGLTWPEGWSADPAAFASGMNLDPNAPLTTADREALEAWHLSVQGEVPGYVDVLAEFNPAALKLWRARYENAAVGPLPKQFIALLQVHQALMIREPKAVRRSIHMARTFGVTRNQLGQILASVQIYQGDLGMHGMDDLDDLLASWSE